MRFRTLAMVSNGLNGGAWRGLQQQSPTHNSQRLKKRGAAEEAPAILFIPKLGELKPLNRQRPFATTPKPLFSGHGPGAGRGAVQAAAGVA